jgi:hypothetical protein
MHKRGITKQQDVTFQTNCSSALRTGAVATLTWLSPLVAEKIKCYVFHVHRHMQKGSIYTVTIADPVYLDLVGQASKFRAIAIFVITDWQTMIHAQCIGMFLIYFRTELKMPSVSASSVLAIKLIPKENVRTAPCCYFTLHKKSLKKGWIFSYI